jgi:hypothetical protein
VGVTAPDDPALLAELAETDETDNDCSRCKWPGAGLAAPLEPESLWAWEAGERSMDSAEAAEETGGNSSRASSAGTTCTCV